MDNVLLVMLLAIPAGGAVVGALISEKAAKYWALLVRPPWASVIDVISRLAKEAEAAPRDRES